MDWAEPASPELVIFLAFEPPFGVNWKSETHRFRSIFSFPAISVFPGCGIGVRGERNLELEPHQRGLEHSYQLDASHGA